MAGAGFKVFNTGDVLTASDVNTFLQQQTVMVFASSAARTSALSGVLAEGMVTYLQDTNSVQVYNGTAFVAVGGSSPLTTKGDLYTFSTTDARLGVGANGTTLVANSATATGLEWATPASGSAFSGCSATYASDISVSNGVEQTLNFTSEDFDVGGYHSTSTNTDLFIIPAGKAGKFLISFYGIMEQGGPNPAPRIVRLYKNGGIHRETQQFYPGSSSGVPTTLFHTSVENGAVGDEFSIRIFQGSGSGRQMLGTNTVTGCNRFNIVFLGA